MEEFPKTISSKLILIFLIRRIREGVEEALLAADRHLAGR
jgi:hypothetical protein